MVPQFYISLLIAITFTSTILLLAASYRVSLDVLRGADPIAANNGPSHASHRESLGDPSETIPHGIYKGPIPETILVVATMADTNVSWVQEELGDLIGDHLGTAFYVSDDSSAPLHTPANKGNEAMVYLTYMIDNYDSLPNISIFLHAHPVAWHNNFLLGLSSSSMVRHLNHEKVVRDGYMNLRCQWNPGCPTHLDPMVTEVDVSKPEEVEIKKAWSAIFPFDKLPEGLAQACCSQFAVTRERIRTLPRERYIHFRNWILTSDLDDFFTGRVFEYFWQYILNSTPIYCPDPRFCYCDGYGVCFEDVKNYEKYFKVATEWQKLERQLKDWKESNHTSEHDQDGVDFVQLDSNFQNAKELANIAAGQGVDPDGKWNRGDWLSYYISLLLKQMSKLKGEALAAGKDPARRVAALRAAQEDPMKVPVGNMTWWM